MENIDNEKSQINDIARSILKSQKYQTGAWNRVVELSRKYALLKTTKTYVDIHGNRVFVDQNRFIELEKLFTDDLLLSVVDAFAEDACVGARLHCIK